ncbi:MAG: ribonuclease J [Bradymonadales bacterium]|nr:MAG: ribonuclease J [Bradymonadales bacterium]
MNLIRELHHSKDLFIVPLGGLGEIGMNMMAFVYQGEALVLDCGASFPENNQLGVDIVVPKIDFFKEYDLDLKAVVITHGHEDHIGGLAHVYDRLGRPKVFSTEFGFGMLEQRLQEFSSFEKSRLQLYSAGKAFGVGPFELEAVQVTHSLVDCYGFAIKTPVGTLAHTGDFKIDREPVDGIHINEDRFKKLGDEGVLLMMSDSTNVEGSGWNHTEKDVRESLEKLIGKIKTGKIIVTLFSSNIHRVDSLMKVAHQTGRKLALAGRSVGFNTDLAARLGFLNIPKDLLIDSRAVEDLPPEKVMVLCTGTQAEPRSALTKMSLNHHPDINIHRGDTVIFSSRHIPGNERRISQLMNNLHRLGAFVIDSREELVHCSGHARREELEHIQKLVRPKFFLPVHGEYRMLVKHFELAKAIRPETLGLVAENGDLLRLTPTSFERFGKVDHGKEFLDENRNRLNERLIKDRKRVASSGLLIVHLIIREKDLKILEGPDFTSSGLPDEVDWIALEDEILRSFEDFSKAKRFDLDAFEDDACVIARRAFRKALGMKPQVFSSIYMV